MNSMRASYLKEMGITEWVSRDPAVSPSMATASTVDASAPTAVSQSSEFSPRTYWWFFGVKPQGDAQILFQNLIKVLGLSPREWSWKFANDDVSQLKLPEDGVAVVAIAFGGPAAQKITGERDPLPQLRETILALNTGNDEEIPVVASQDLSQVVGRPEEKAMLWQDLLLAKSILQNS